MPFQLHLATSQVDEDQSGEIEFPEFLKAVEAHKIEHAGQKDESDTVEAFVALGGNVSPCSTARGGMW
jgi:hypothetical protein